MVFIEIEQYLLESINKNASKPKYWLGDKCLTFGDEFGVIVGIKYTDESDVKPGKLTWLYKVKFDERKFLLIDEDDVELVTQSA